MNVTDIILFDVVMEFLQESMVHVEAVVPYGQGELINLIHRLGIVELEVSKKFDVLLKFIMLYGLKILIQETDTGQIHEHLALCLKLTCLSFWSFKWPDLGFRVSDMIRETNTREIHEQ